MVASRIRRLRRLKGGYGRHGDGDYFFDVLDVLKRRTVGCSFGRSLCVAGLALPRGKRERESDMSMKGFRGKY